MSKSNDHIGKSWPPRLLEKVAADLRTALDLQGEWSFDVLTAIWRAAKLDGPFRGLALMPLDDEKMGGKDAWATSDPPTITLKLSLFDRFNKGDPDAKFTLTHELFHVLLHSDHPATKKFFVHGGTEKLKYAHDDVSLEAQANYVTRAFLMPPEFVHQIASPEELAAKCVVPLRETRSRFKELRIDPRPRKQPNFVAEYLSDANRTCSRPSNIADF